MNFCHIAAIFTGLKGRRLKSFNPARIIDIVFTMSITIAACFCVNHINGETPRLIVREKVLAVEGKGIVNMRDLGGWKNRDGQIIRKGMIFRSAAFDCSFPKWYKLSWKIPENSRKYLVETLGIKTDLDLRKDEDETSGTIVSPLGEDVSRLHIPSCEYENLDTPSGRESCAKIFKVFLDKNNYPIVFHCRLGQDRAGSLAILLESLLGMNEEDIRYDYEYSWKIRGSKKLRHAGFDDLVEMLKKYKGDNLNKRVENFVKSIGVSDKDITVFRAIMLEPTEPYVTRNQGVNQND